MRREKDTVMDDRNPANAQRLSGRKSTLDISHYTASTSTEFDIFQMIATFDWP